MRAVTHSNRGVAAVPGGGLAVAVAPKGRLGFEV
jgi:hypothetical protein